MKRKTNSFIFLFSLGWFCTSLFSKFTLYLVKGGSSIRQLFFTAYEMAVINNEGINVISIIKSNNKLINK